MGEQVPTWIVAVSGGIDSVVLLDILAKHSRARLVVAHIDHGIRDDGEEDLIVVQKHAASRSLHLEYTKLSLGALCSEAKARTARYEWLDRIARQYDAEYIVTAHHQDDALETIVINHLRGTGWKGLASLRSTATRYRPLLHMSKARIIAYALHHGLEWRDDHTNEDVRYLRNAVRAAIIPKLSSQERHRLLHLYESQVHLISAVDAECRRITTTYMRSHRLSRYWLTMMPTELAGTVAESMIGYRLQQQHRNQLIYFARSARLGAQLELPDGLRLRATTDELIVPGPHN